MNTNDGTYQSNQKKSWAYPATRAKQNTCTGADLVALYDFLRSIAEDGYIDKKVREITEHAEIALHRSLSTSTIYTAIESLKLTYKKPRPARSLKATGKPSEIEALMNRVAVLEEQVKYLMRELTSPKEFAEACSHEVLSPTAVEMNV